MVYVLYNDELRIYESNADCLNELFGKEYTILPSNEKIVENLKHWPSDQNWAALKERLELLEKMANQVSKVESGSSPSGVTTTRTTYTDGTCSVDFNCKCGKPLTYSDKHGMFCEDKCGYEESVKASAEINAFCESLAGLFS